MMHTRAENRFEALMTLRAGAALIAALAGAGALAACSGDAQAMSPQRIEQQYGVEGAYNDTVATADGKIKGTLVPVTLADGRTAQLFIPTKAAHEPHPVYLRDNEGLHPVSVRHNATRDEITRAPAVQRQAEPAHSDKRSWEKEALIIGGTAAGGAAIGAIAGGKKGAGIGAAAGGVGGLVYDLLTRDKK